MRNREPGIERLVRSFNAICAQMQDIAPRRAFLPRPIDMKGLYKLDVDDAIWQDAGLGGETEDDIPRWMSDKSVKEGIKCLLQLDRCIEEEYRLKKERCTLQKWLQEEWQCLQQAIKISSTFLFVTCLCC